VAIKKERKKEKKWTSVRSRIRGKRPEKEEKKKIKIAHVFLQLFLNPNERNVFKRAKVELELDTLYTPI
jgi:5-formyltetrahydrofolate cyclo-ligase